MSSENKLCYIIYAQKLIINKRFILKFPEAFPDPHATDDGQRT